MIKRIGRKTLVCPRELYTIFYDVQLNIVRHTYLCTIIKYYITAKKQSLV